MNIPPLTKSLATTPVESFPALDIVADLAHKCGYALNSWFVIGHFESEGHTLNHLVHLFARSIGELTVGVDSVASITDEPTIRCPVPDPMAGAGACARHAVGCDAEAA